MKKDKFFYEVLVVLLLTIVSAVFIHLYILTEIKSMAKEKVRLEEQLVTAQNKIERSIVELQRYSSEARIVEIAKKELGLIRSTKPFQRIVIEEDEVKKIERIVNSKYE